MIGHFEVISASSPHIYHSALVLAPKESIVWKLYEQYARHFIRIVQGAPTSNAAAKTHSSKIEEAIWSPCNRFIAIASVDTGMVDLVDSTTLQHLQTLESPQDVPTEGKHLAFSPDSCMLSCGSGNETRTPQFAIISWDLQTGGIVSVIRHKKRPDLVDHKEFSLVYSADGKVFGFSHLDVWFYDKNYINISIFDVFTGILLHSHSLDTQIKFLKNIWVHGESFQFTTADQTTITTWEVRPTLGTPPTIVETFSAPCADEVLGQLLSASYQLASFQGAEFQVWDVRNSRQLLKYRCTSGIQNISFSPDGHFLACSIDGSQINIWNESPNGYILHGKILPVARCTRLCFSPNGKSIIAWGDHTIQLWHTEGFITPPSTQAPKQNNKFALDLSLDRMVAAFAMFRDNIVTVLDLKHGTPQLTIDMGMDVVGLGIIGSGVFVICEERHTTKVVTWDLPSRGCIQNARVSHKDSSGIVKLTGICGLSRIISASISPDSNTIGLISSNKTQNLTIWNLSTGECCHYLCGGEYTVQFSPDGCNIWCAQDGGKATVWRVGAKSQKPAKRAASIEDPPEGNPWASPHGHKVTNDWWILGPDGKRLLLLPVHWRSEPVHRRWKGQFLALLHCGLPQPVILSVDP